MTKYSTAKGLVDTTKDLPYYEVIDADHENDTDPPTPWRIPAAHVPEAEWAWDEEDAACMWAEARWSDYDYPDEMVALVTHSDGRKWRVLVAVEMIPSFRGHVEQVKP